MGDGKCSKFFIFKRRVHSIQNFLICLETLSWKIRFFSKEKLEQILGDGKCSKFYIFQRGVHSTQNDLIWLEILSWKTLFFRKNLEKILGAESTWNDLMCLESLFCLRNPEFNHVTLRLPFTGEVTLKIGQKWPKWPFWPFLAIDLGYSSYEKKPKRNMVEFGMSQIPLPFFFCLSP